jgi:hypothetical protein
VKYLSQTYEGKRHDKKIADEENPTYPEDIGVYQDTGFQGYAPEGVKTFQPQKKPKGKELSSEQKERNRLISRMRSQGPSDSSGGYFPLDIAPCLARR